MTKWLRKKNIQDEYKYRVENGGVYVFHGPTYPNGAENNNYIKGTGVPDHIAEALLKTGEYEEVTSEWHKKIGKEKDEALIKKYLANVPKEVQSIMFRTHLASPETGEKAVRKLKGE